MSTKLEVLEAEVLQLAPSERSHLLERVLASLDTDPEVEAFWTTEADRREASRRPAREGEAGRGSPPAEPAGRGGEPTEERVPGQHVARAANAAQRHHRLLRASL